MDTRNFHIRYSGGAGNSTPANSIGGGRSNTEVPKTPVPTLSVIQGVTVLEVGNCAPGEAEIAQNGTTWLAFRCAGEEFGPQLYTSSLLDGTYILTVARGPDYGYVLFSLAKAAITSGLRVEQFTVTPPVNNLFADVPVSEAITGSTVYRCVYLTNTDVSTVAGLRVYVPVDLQADDTIEIALDPAGVGNGSSTGLAPTLVDENDSTDVLSGLTWASPRTAEEGLVMNSEMDTNESVPLWIRRIVPPYSTKSVSQDNFKLAVEFYAP